MNLTQVSEYHFTDNENYDILYFDDAIFINYWDNLHITRENMMAILKKGEELIPSGEFIAISHFTTRMGDMDDDVKEIAVGNHPFLQRRSMEIIIMPHMGMRLLYLAYKSIYKPKHENHVVRSMDNAYKILTKKEIDVAKYQSKIDAILNLQGGEK